MRHGEYKVPGGKLVVVDYRDHDNTITEFSLSGDFFLEPDETLLDINRAVNGLSVDAGISELEAAITGALDADAVLLGVTPQAIAITTRRAHMDAARWRDLDWAFVRTPALSPVLNVALDEVLLGEVAAGRRPPTMRLWEWDADAVIIGSFQSVRNEIDEEAAAATGTQIIRRISGGGAMYMQPANSLSYSLYVPGDFVEGMSFEASYAFLDEWIIEALHTIGVHATYRPLNDITSPAGKIGGAAQKRLANGTVLHHATLAYDMDGERMTRILRIGREKLSDKGTKSAAKRVDPLRSQTGLSREAIMDHFVTTFEQRHGSTPSTITPEELDRARELVAEKFESADWTHRIP